MFYQVRKTFICSGIVIFSMIYFQNLYAEEIIKNRTGNIRIIQPDGVILNLKETDKLPALKSGSIIEVRNGSIDIAPVEGFVQVLIGDSVARVEAGDSVTASIYLATRMTGFVVNSGKIDIITGETIMSVKTGQEVQIGFDQSTGAVKVGSISGNIQTVTAGVRVLILPLSITRVNVNQETQEVNVDSIEGMAEVISPEGEVAILSIGESTDFQGSFEIAEMSLEIESETIGETTEEAIGATGEPAEDIPEETIELMPELPAEEPPEPEALEASPYMP